MTNYVLDEQDLSALFDSSISPISFSQNPRNHIPITGSIIYSVWDKGEKFIYIHDFYVIPSLLNATDFKPKRGALDKLTKDFIHKNLSHRFVSFQTEDSDVIVRSLENQIKSGSFGLKPLLNGNE